MDQLFDAMKKANLASAEDKDRIHAELVDEVVKLECDIRKLREGYCDTYFGMIMRDKYESYSEDSLRRMRFWLKWQFDQYKTCEHCEHAVGHPKLVCRKADGRGYGQGYVCRLISDAHPCEAPQVAIKRYDHSCSEFSFKRKGSR